MLVNPLFHIFCIFFQVSIICPPWAHHTIGRGVGAKPLFFIIIITFTGKIASHNAHDACNGHLQ
jgi:hypothetical protein